MAKLTQKDVLKLAQLARLELSDAEMVQFQDEISKILTYVEQLNEVDVSDAEPTSQITGLANQTRPDVIKPAAYTQEELFKNTPSLSSDGYIKVRRMFS